MTDLNPEPNLAEWQQTVREIIDSPRVARYFDALDRHVRDYIASLPEEERSKRGFSESENHRTHLYKMADLLLPEQDKSMSAYAKSWDEVSRQHAENGLYRQLVEFFRPEQGLLVDLGCGTGRFLAEMPFESAIGVDINHYCLQAAESLLSQRGRRVKRYSRTYISFDPDRGFILKPYPVMDEVDLTETVLLTDDIEKLDSTIRVLYNQGRKADMVSFTLSGGYTNKSPLQFIDFMDLGDQFWEKRKVEHGQNIADAVTNNVNKLCRSGGRFFLATRLLMQDEKQTYVDEHEKLGQEIAKQHPNIDVVRTTSIPMIQEHDMQGIQIDGRLQLPDGTLRPWPADSKNIPYRLYLFDMRVR